MKIRPLCDNVVLRFLEADDKTSSGIVLTGTVKDSPKIAEVVAVGPGGTVKGEKIVMSVRVGDKVIAAKYSGTEIKIDGDDYLVIHHNDILAIVE